MNTVARERLSEARTVYYTILCYAILYYTNTYDYTNTNTNTNINTKTKTNTNNNTNTNTYTILYYTILHYTTLYYTILHYTTLYYTILHYTTLYYTTPYYTILHYTIVLCRPRAPLGGSSRRPPVLLINIYSFTVIIITCLCVI